MYDPMTLLKSFKKEKNMSKSLLWDDGSRPFKELEKDDRHLGNVSVIINSGSDMSISNEQQVISNESAELVFPNENIDKFDYGLSLNIIKSVLGMGILGITYTFKQSGYFYFFIMLLLSLITGYNAVNIGKFITEFKKMEKYKDNHLTYFNLAEEIFGTKMKRLTQAVWSIEIISCCILIINLSFTFLNQLFDLTDNFYLLSCMILFFYCITFIKNYDKIKFLSILGLCAIFLLFCFILYNLINDLYHHNLPKNEYKPFNYKDIPKSIAITLFSFGGHVVFPEIFSSIKNTKKLKKNIIYTWTTFTIFVNCFVFTGFILFGDSIHDNIINNLNQSYWFKKIITTLLLLNVIFTFPLMYTPLNLRIILNVKNLKINESFKKFLYKYFIRLCLIIIICIIGSYWKSYLNIMSIVGGLLENTTSILLPCIFSLKYLKLNLFEKIINILIIEFGLVLMGFTIFNCFY